jgi:hypothetical protein
MPMTDESQLIKLATEKLLHGSGQHGKAGSKYDFVKVKVWLGENLEHYYILSRFLISRLLTMIKLPQQKVNTC